MKWIVMLCCPVRPSVKYEGKSETSGLFPYRITSKKERNLYCSLEYSSSSFFPFLFMNISNNLFHIHNLLPSIQSMDVCKMEIVVVNRRDTTKRNLSNQIDYFVVVVEAGGRMDRPGILLLFLFKSIGFA